MDFGNTDVHVVNRSDLSQREYRIYILSTLWQEHIYIIFDVYCEALIKSSVFTFVNLGNNLCSSSVRQKIAEEDKVQTTTMTVSCFHAMFAIQPTRIHIYICFEK